MHNPFEDIIQKLNAHAIYPKLSKVMREDSIECDGLYLEDVSPLLVDEKIEQLERILYGMNVTYQWFPNLGELYIKLKV